ncbi:MAG: SH3 domain-containing protein [Chloroflexi bacterium]|nr:SH3 domain-containing protein [Chloroflexota bacterium]
MTARLWLLAVLLGVWGVFPVQQQTCTLTVTASALFVRTGPSEGYDTIGSVSEGQILTLIGRSADSAWGRIEFIGERGWLSLDPAFVDLDCDVDALPVVTVPDDPAGERLVTPQPTPATAVDDPSPVPPSETAPPATEPTPTDPPPTRTPTEPSTAEADAPAVPTAAPSGDPAGGPPLWPFLLGAVVVIGGGAAAFAASRSRAGEAEAAVEPTPKPAEPAPEPPTAIGPPVRIEPPPAEPVEDLDEVPADANAASLIPTPEGPLPSAGGPSLSADVTFLLRLLVENRKGPRRYVPLAILSESSGRPAYAILEIALRLRRVYPNLIRVGRYPDGTIGIFADDALIRARIYD